MDMASAMGGCSTAVRAPCHEEPLPSSQLAGRAWLSWVERYDCVDARMPVGATVAHMVCAAPAGSSRV